MKVGGLRDRILWRVANTAISLCSPTYRSFVAGSVKHGMGKALLDIQRDGRSLDFGYTLPRLEEGADGE